MIATTGPLLQRWYSWGDHARSEDPYFLFAASNLGSFGGLLAYPLLIEPHLTLAAQRTWWSGGFLVFVALTATCALSVRSGRVPAARAGARTPVTAPPNRKQVLTWSALAFLPSSLMLGVTSHITTDVAAIPLLWVVPLAIYLATFVLAFSKASRIRPARATQWAVAAAFAIAITSVGLNVAVTLTIVVNLAMLALVAYAAHARLAAERPAAEHLTTLLPRGRDRRSAGRAAERLRRSARLRPRARVLTGAGGGSAPPRGSPAALGARSCAAAIPALRPGAGGC